jgi:hypothetical protein
MSEPVRLRRTYGSSRSRDPGARSRMLTRWQSRNCRREPTRTRRTGSTRPRSTTRPTEPQIGVIAVAADGRRALTRALRPQVDQIALVSPIDLVDAIRSLGMQPYA